MTPSNGGGPVTKHSDPDASHTLVVFHHWSGLGIQCRICLDDLWIEEGDEVGDVTIEWLTELQDKHRAEAAA